MLFPQQELDMSRCVKLDCGRKAEEYFLDDCS